MHKAPIVESKQIEHVINERKILEEACAHPFCVRICGAYQDRNSLYLLQASAAALPTPAVLCPTRASTAHSRSAPPQHLLNHQQQPCSPGTSLPPPLPSWLPQEWVPGGELFHHLDVEGAFDEPTAMFYAANVLLALEFLHNKGIVYRDLKPENLLLDTAVRCGDGAARGDALRVWVPAAARAASQGPQVRSCCEGVCGGEGWREPRHAGGRRCDGVASTPATQGYIKMADFGFAKYIGVDKTYTICGTPDYQAPEVRASSLPTHPADTHSAPATPAPCLPMFARGPPAHAHATPAPNRRSLWTLPAPAAPGHHAPRYHQGRGLLGAGRPDF